MDNGRLTDHHGKTVDFRRFADRGMTLLGMTQGFEVWRDQRCR